MRDFLLKQYVRAQILREDHGQDLIEYALVVALIAFAATAGMGTVANDINKAFTSIGAKLVSYTS
jgi:pilus assembly protein Flp/PilA